ncbi:glycoside hydrolase family 32 protein [Alkalihalobacillus sp. 1P02AB]|uniref:glycoside hydrolase family 32 protein n=1 Tax=Alkalihalobacillus sp. 1P02AB TaxID=3132260 RepID=UPI0039A59013
MIKRRLLVVFGLAILLLSLVGYQILNGGAANVKIEHEAQSDYYTETYRPQFHFSTPVGNLADPNGLIFFEGEYHLFHQKNGMWAHASSPDLVHWEHMDIALDHDILGQALSGSAVIDWNDTTGFFDGKAGMVAIYTSTAGGEAQGIAYSKDNGRTWERYEGNPVIENPGIKDFRDPKVFWHDESAKWVMVVSTDKSVTFYNSDNLIDWEYQSEFGEGHGSHVAVWECPDLFRLPVDGDEENQKWVLHVSVGDNEETNGSTAQYFIGEFDGTQFIHEQDPETVLITDFGQDFYAAQSFSGIPDKDGRHIWLGWMANWRYPYQSPTDPWIGSMSIPRQLSLKTMENGLIQLVQEPIKELESLRASEFQLEPFDILDEHLLEFQGTTYEFETIMEWDDLDEFGIRLRQGHNEETVIGINLRDEKVFLDRTNSGLSELTDRNGELFSFGARFEQDYDIGRGEIKIHGFVDESSVEIFINDGEQVFTNLIYTTPTNQNIELYTKGGEVHVSEWSSYHLKSVWRERPDDGEMERLVLSNEHLEIALNGTAFVDALIKPDWLEMEADELNWIVEDPDLLEVITENGEKWLKAKAVGSTSIRVTDSKEQVESRMTIRVVE